MTPSRRFSMTYTRKNTFSGRIQGCRLFILLVIFPQYNKGNCTSVIWSWETRRMARWLFNRWLGNRWKSFNKRKRNRRKRLRNKRLNGRRKRCFLSQILPALTNSGHLQHVIEMIQFPWIAAIQQAIQYFRNNNHNGISASNYKPSTMKLRRRPSSWLKSGLKI